jgi:hypothetical protein
MPHLHSGLTKARRYDGKYRAASGSALKGTRGCVQRCLMVISAELAFCNSHHPERSFGAVGNLPDLYAQSRQSASSPCLCGKALASSPLESIEHRETR